MAIINSLYLYCTGWKATQQTYQYCRNPLHHHKKLFNPRQRGSNSVRLLSGPNAKSNNRSIYGCNMRNNSHTDNTGNSKKSKTVNSSYSTSIMNCEQDSFRDIKLCSNYSENTKFGLMKIIRTCNLMSFLLNEKQMCSKHFELIKLFIEQLQTIIEHLEKDIDNTLKNLVNFSIDIFSEKIVTKGSKYLKTIINCSECNEKSFIDSPLMKHFNNESFSTEHCDHYYNSTKLGQSKSQNHTLDDNKIKSSSNCRTNRFWSHLLSHTKIDCHQMADVTYSDTSFQFYPTKCVLESISSLSSDSCSLPLFCSTNYLSSSSSSSSSSSLLSPLSSPHTYSTCTSVSNNSVKSPEEETVEKLNFKQIATYHCQTLNDLNRNVRLENKQINDRLFMYHPINVNDEEYKKQNSSLKKSVGEQKIPLCLFHSKCHMRDSPVHGYSQQYLQRNKQSEIENCNINLNEIYPHSVSRRPSVRDILNQRKNDHTLCEKKQQQDKQQIHLFDQSSKNYTDDNIAKSIKTNFYISNGHINCHHSNLCFSHSDYLFSENNLNMGVVPPPNLNPFAS
uniref:C2H2-type domain-containing protein n=1 Tax=Schistosoma mansoni TaxID=6183 RepID=A0A3Q0KL13_SCHMA